MSDNNTPAVGFGSPPVKSRFKKGQSGNPRGRPPKPDDIYTLLQRVLKRKVRMKGAERQIPISEALIHKLKDLALSGDRRAYDLQLQILDEAGVNKYDPYDPEETKRKVIRAFERMGVKATHSEDEDV